MSASMPWAIGCIALKNVLALNSSAVISHTDGALSRSTNPNASVTSICVNVNAITSGWRPIPRARRDVRQPAADGEEAEDAGTGVERRDQRRAPERRVRGVRDDRYRPEREEPEAPQHRDEREVDEPEVAVADDRAELLALAREHRHHEADRERDLDHRNPQVAQAGAVADEVDGHHGRQPAGGVRAHVQGRAAVGQARLLAAEVDRDGDADDEGHGAEDEERHAPRVRAG